MTLNQNYVVKPTSVGAVWKNECLASILLGNSAVRLRAFFFMLGYAAR
jgi:hypothetical protein